MTKKEKLTTCEKLVRMSHLLTELDTGEKWRSAEIANIRTSIGLAIQEFEEDVPDAEEFGIEMIELLRQRIDSLAADPANAGNHECYQVILPPVDAAADTERNPNEK